MARETDGPEGTLSNKCLKSLELMAQSLRKVENNIKDLSSYPGFEVNLNLESLLTLNVENQHAVTHFKKETFTLYEYAQIFGSSVEEGAKRVTPWSAHFYAHPSSYVLAEPSAAGQLVSVEIPKPVGERLSRNEEAEMRMWAKRFGKCVRQRIVRQDNTMDRAGTLPLNLYETQTSLNPLDLQFVFPHAQSSVPDESPESELMNILWRLSPAPINVTTTAAVKAETVSQTRIVQMIELVFIWLCQQGLEEKECSPAEGEIFFSPGEGTCIQIASISAFNLLCA